MSFKKTRRKQRRNQSETDVLRVIRIAASVGLGAPASPAGALAADVRLEMPSAAKEASNGLNSIGMRPRSPPCGLHDPLTQVLPAH